MHIGGAFSKSISTCLVQTGLSSSKHHCNIGKCERMVTYLCIHVRKIIRSHIPYFCFDAPKKNKCGKVGFLAFDKNRRCFETTAGYALN